MMHEYLIYVNKKLEEYGINKRIKKLPKLLYKYRNFSCDDNCKIYSLENLKNGVEYLNTTDCFNDPYDARIFIDEIMSKNCDMPLEELKLDMQRKTLVTCFSESNIKTNLLMWNHYAHNHEGFCIAYDMQELLAMKKTDQTIDFMPIYYDTKPANLTEVIRYYCECLYKGIKPQSSELIRMYKTVLIKS